MSVIYTDLRNTRRSAKELSFDPTGNVTGLNVQSAIQQVDVEAAAAQSSATAAAASAAAASAAAAAASASAAGKVAQVGTARLPVAAATINILTSDIEVGIDATSTAVACPLPSAAAWATANPNGLELTIFDFKGQAPTHNITPSLNGADTFVQGIVPIIKSAYGEIKLRPMGTSWYVRATN